MRTAVDQEPRLTCELTHFAGSPLSPAASNQPPPNVQVASAILSRPRVASWAGFLAPPNDSTLDNV